MQNLNTQERIALKSAVSIAIETLEDDRNRSLKLGMDDSALYYADRISVLREVRIKLDYSTDVVLGSVNDTGPLFRERGINWNP